MYVESVPNRNSRPAILLREGWREGARTRKRTLANLTDWPPAQVEALRAVLRGDFPTLAPSAGFSIERTRPHGHVAAVLGTVRRVRDRAGRRAEARGASGAGCRAPRRHARGGGCAG